MAGRKSSRPAEPVPSPCPSGPGDADPGTTASATLFKHLTQFLATRLRPGDRLGVAFSGGRDSLVLLDALHRLARGQTAAGELPRFVLSAVHVNHGLSANAADWARFCAAFCAERELPLEIVELGQIDAAGEGLEAAARRLRYAAFARCRTDWLALAHHRDDQAETLLMRLLRGAGVAGAAGIPVERALAAQMPDAPRLIRPLLDLPRSLLSDYAAQHGLRWIEDESNADCRHRRNFLRHRILPQLATAFPGADAALARAAGHFAEARQLLDELALIDRERLAPAGGALPLAAFNALPAPRARNLLRHELHACGLPAPDSRWLEEARRQLAAASPETCVELPSAALRVFRGFLHLLPARPEPPLRLAWPASLADCVPCSAALTLDWGGETLSIRATVGAGISRARLLQGEVCFTRRQGGERLQPDPRRPRRSLKKLLQESGLPPWQRERLPLLWSGEQLAWVGGVGVDAAFACADGEPGFVLDFVPV